MNKYWYIFIIFVRIVCTSAQDANCDWLASDTLAISSSPILVPEAGCAMSQTITVSNNEILIVTGEKRESPFAQLTTGFETETAATYCSADWTDDAACSDNSAYAPDVSCYVAPSLLDCQTTCANILSCNGVSYDNRNWCLFCKSSSKDLASSFTSHANWNTYWKLRNRHFHVKVNAILRISYLTLMGGKVNMNVAKPTGYGGGSILIDGRWCDNDVLYGGTTACGTSVNTNEGDQPIVVLSSVVLQGNQAKKGGGLYVLYYGDLTLTNVIFDGNIAEGVTVTDISATNFITNGDFSNGLTGWTIPSSKLGRSVGVYSAGVVRNKFKIKTSGECTDDEGWEYIMDLEECTAASTVLELNVAPATNQGWTSIPGGCVFHLIPTVDILYVNSQYGSACDVNSQCLCKRPIDYTVADDFYGCPNTCGGFKTTVGYGEHKGIDACVVPCGAGQYYTEGALGCTNMTNHVCQPGYTFSSPSGTTTDKYYMVGSQADDGVCTACPKGTDQTTTGATKCKY